MNDNKAFVSGSHVYGTPNKKSDIDIVVMMDEAVARWLHSMLHNGDENSNTPAFGSLAIRHGDINLICCWSEWVYNLWFKGTDALHKVKPVTRDQAIALFDTLRFCKQATEIKHKQFVNSLNVEIDDIPY